LNPVSKTEIIDQVKTWLTPSVICILGMFIWRDLSELRADVKQLLAQSTEDHIKIGRLEEDIDFLKKRVFLNESAGFQNKPAVWNSNYMAARPMFLSQPAVTGGRFE
jgi:hypothetical protein